jgi:hypothetical protein
VNLAVKSTARLMLASFICAATMSSFAADQSLQAAPKLTSERVLLLAQAELAKCAPVGSSYTPSTPEYVPAGREWWVHFKEDHINIAPHSGMVVVVNDRTERVCVLSGSDPGVVGQCT